MKFQIEHINLTNANLIPAYDLEADSSFIAFRTPGIPWCKYALDEMVVVLHGTDKVCLYSPDTPNICYTFSCTLEEYAYMCALYMAQIAPVQ